MADDAPEKRSDTHILWDQLLQEEFEIIVSPVVYEEIGKCGDELENELLRYLNILNVTPVAETAETLSLANTYLSTGVMPSRTKNDCRHIAIASIYGCRYILSWNMKHFVKRKTIEMVQKVNGRIGITQPNIITPTIFIEGDE